MNSLKVTGPKGPKMAIFDDFCQISRLLLSDVVTDAIIVVDVVFVVVVLVVVFIIVFIVVVVGVVVVVVDDWK